MELHERPLRLGFETGDRAHWIAEGEAFVNQPVQGDRVSASQARPALVALGGDYWDGHYPVGNLHQYWIHTEDHLTGTLTSREFVIDGNYPWFSFLIGGGQDIANLRVELLVRATAANAEKFATRSYPFVSIPERGDFLTLFAETGNGSEIMRRVVFNVISAQLVGEHGCVRIVDTTSTNHISVDDVRFSSECPEVAPLIEGGGDASAPVWGFADLHAHPMASLAFGGVPFWGQSDGPIEIALANCTPAHGIGGTGLTLSKGVGNFLMAFFEETGYSPGLLGWLYPGHRVGGFPDFDGWPKFTTIIHQQMYIDWIKRAYEGGLRLMVAHVINNELLAHEFSRRHSKEPHNDRAVVEIQLTAMKELVARHADWMEIAYCAADARRIIRRNKLAIVLGVEVDSLGNWHRPEDCSEDEIRSYLYHLYHDLGVRHLFPIHLANNAFGGSAIYSDLYNVINRFLRDDYFQVEDGSVDGVEFRLGEDPGPAVGRYKLPPKPFYAPPDYSQVSGGHVNVKGLTPHGQLLVKEMIRLGMLIDIDHMSYKAVDQTLEIVEAFDYPVVSGHTHFQELAWHRQETANIHKCSSEFFKTPQQLERIGKLGGMIAPILNQQDNRDVGDVIPSLAGKISQHCAGSSTSWAQAYLYATEKMKGKGVGIGTDMNGFYKSPCPRFGLNAAYYLHYNIPSMGQDSLRQTQRRDQAFAQSNGVRYTTPVKDVRNYRFEGVIEGDEDYDSVERDIWQAIGLYHADGDPSAHQPPSVLSSRVTNLVRGFRVASTGRLSCPASRRRALSSKRANRNMLWERRAAFLVKTGQLPSASDPEPVQRMYDKILPIWQLWQVMQGANIPLHRSYAGHRDFDINIDGVAHYGMLPDFIQDMKNVGLTDEDLLPLFRSAEEYIRVWEKCERRRG